MKQKIIIKVQMTCDKCRSKALKIAAKARGVDSVALEGAEKDRVVVIGEGVDPASLTCQLRKKVGYSSLESVVEEKGKDEPKKEADHKGKVEEDKEVKEAGHGVPIYYPAMYEVVVCNEPDPTSCSIM